MHLFFNIKSFNNQFLSSFSRKYFILFLILGFCAPFITKGACCSLSPGVIFPCVGDPTVPGCYEMRATYCDLGTCRGATSYLSMDKDLVTRQYECNKLTCPCTGNTDCTTTCSSCSTNNLCQKATWTNLGPCGIKNVKPGTTPTYVYDSTCTNLCSSSQTCSNATGIPQCVSTTKPVCSVTASASPNPIPFGQSSVTISKTGSGYTSCAGTGTFSQSASTQTYTVSCTGDSSHSDCKDTITVTKSACTNMGLSTPTINPVSPTANTSFTVSCPTAKTGLSNVFANANTNSNPCSFTGWSGNTASFSCTGMALGHYEAKCYSTAINGYCADSTTGGYTVIATPTSDTSCSRCSNDSSYPCKNASWTNIGSCNIYSLKPGTSVSYTTNDSCDNCSSGKSCSNGICIINPVVTHNECNTSQQCVPAPGSGTNLCSSNSGCISGSTSCSPYGTYDCTMANGCAGTKTCNYAGTGYGICYQNAGGCSTTHSCTWKSCNSSKICAPGTQVLPLSTPCPLDSCTSNSCGTTGNKCGIDASGNAFCGASGTGTSCASNADCGTCKKR